MASSGLSPLKIVCNVDLATAGVDLPFLNALQICRKTNSLIVHIQMFGRAVRVHPAPVGPRPYQQALEEDVFKDRQPVCIVAPTSAGKSHIVASIVKRLLRDGKRVSYVVKRRSLVSDMSMRLKRDGVEHGLWMPPHRPTDCPVQVASADTLISRSVGTGADVLILDEAHTLANDGGRQIISMHKNAWVVGMTATCIGVGSLFTRIAMGPTMAELMDMGFISQYRLFAPPAPDFSTAQTSGDYNQTIAGKIMTERRIVGDVVSTWKKLAGNGATLLFASSVEQSKAYCDAFNAAGIPAGHVDASTPDAERMTTWSRLKDGAVPKNIALVIDHVSNTTELGYPDDIISWSLDERPPRRKSDDDPSLAGRHCPKCLLFYRTNVETCPECGTAHIKTVKEVHRIKGELEEIQRQRKSESIAKALAKMDPAMKFAQLKAEGAAKGFAPGWAKVRFKVLFGRWPSN